jgi:hypothetical protein
MWGLHPPYIHTGTGAVGGFSPPELGSVAIVVSVVIVAHGISCFLLLRSVQKRHRAKDRGGVLGHRGDPLVGCPQPLPARGERVGLIAQAREGCMAKRFRGREKKKKTKQKKNNKKACRKL